MNIDAIVVPDTVKPIPPQWVNDVELDEFGAEMGDVIGEGPVLAWSSEERKQRYQHALRRLDLNEEMLSSKRITLMSKTELGQEKKRVKAELKRYDTDWKKQFKVLPNHSQKEVMRPLYLYYRRLKNQLATADSGARDQDSDDDLLGRQPGPESARSGRRTNKEKAELQISQLEARANSLQQEKGAIRTKLKEFQENFLLQHHRKIRFHKDILPIEKEYRMYKNIKEELQKVAAALALVNCTGFVNTGIQGRLSQDVTALRAEAKKAKGPWVGPKKGSWVKILRPESYWHLGCSWFQQRGQVVNVNQKPEVKYPVTAVKFDSVNYANVNTNGYALWEVIEAPAPGPGEVEVQCCERHRFTVPSASLIQRVWFHLVFMCQWMQSDLLAMRKSP
ncbi:PSAE [Symbiodinium necroappetens]|uniref:PSAE protein n=1 Tax=Symbiodinium necroappetens TaxID=1628268 RepID=A0A812SKE0_9DINO|nr:PSAE [Symbiodinium necroappetens]